MRPCLTFQLIYSLSGKSNLNWPFLSLRHLNFLLLLCGFVEERDQVVPVLLLLETGEHHLRAGNILLGVRQIDVQSVRRPGDAYMRRSST